MDTASELLYSIALSNIPAVGTMISRKLISMMGSAQNILSTDKKTLVNYEHIPLHLADNIIKSKADALQKAEEEISFMEKNNISALLYNDKAYPDRLKQCPDAPLVLFARGNFDANAKHCISIVGTRKCTAYGINSTKMIVEQLAEYNPLIISGLALGIDAAAHQAALENNLATIGILGHGLKFIYPASNRGLAKRMLDNGGVMTEFTSDTNGDAFNFPRRNRIIAGMSDAIIVIEAHARGGALITANLAFSYDRDVFALPGKVSDAASAGCNNLIKNNKAALITSGEDIANMMNWIGKHKRKNKKNEIQQLLINFEPTEQSIIQALQQKEGINIDELALITDIDHLTLANVLLSLELQGYIVCMPGKKYYLHLQ